MIGFTVYQRTKHIPSLASAVCSLSFSISEATAVFKSPSGTEALEDYNGHFLDKYTDGSSALEHWAREEESSCEPLTP